MQQHPTELRGILMKRDITEVYICGLALDVCVGMFLNIIRCFCQCLKLFTFVNFTLDVSIHT